MVAYPAPTYVVGVHEDEERAFIISVRTGMVAKISSITTAHELNQATLEKLWEEVRAFWLSRDMTQRVSAFSN